MIVEVHKLQKADGKGPLQIEQQLGALKPALMQMLQKRCEDADSEEGGLEAVGSTALDSRKLPTIGASAGFKVFGSALPPLGRSPAAVLDGDAAVTPSLKMRVSMAAAARGRAEAPSDRGNTPDTPTKLRSKGSLLSPIAAKKRLESDASLEVPKYSQIMAGPKGKLGSIKLGVETASSLPGSPSGVLDATEEQLIQYLMDDQKAGAA